jgi:aerobic-type carbon monoxide dehydrogenase small subunit (CoxS/CutS family)
MALELMDAQMMLGVDGEQRSFSVDTHTTLLDLLPLAVGCHPGQRGVCTVLLKGR